MRKENLVSHQISDGLISISGGRAARAFAFLFFPMFLLLTAAYFALPVKGEAKAADLPSDFVITTIATGLKWPVDMVFLPMGDIFVAEKGAGQAEKGSSSVKLVQNGIVQDEPVLTLSTNTFWDSGLMAIALDPNFAENNWFYVWYATGETSKDWTGESALRVSRFEFDRQSGKADLNGEIIIFEDKPWFNYHQGNLLFFDRDGNLFVGMGNRGQLSASQDMSVLFGKIIRIRPNETGYDIPADNPYLSDPNVRPEIYVSGIRNVYRMAGRAEDGVVVFGDVGANIWEEINLLSPAANYGYPEREGPCPINQKQPCEPAPPHYTDPMISYLHDEALGIGTSGAVTGMTFYEGEGYPEVYHNKLFFTDFNQRFIGVADPPAGEYDLFADNLGYLVDLEYYLDGLYTLEVFTGKIKLITYSEQSNQPPTAVISASTLLGASPLEVTFSAASSTDTDDIVVFYHWEFGDGSLPLVTNEAEVHHIYEDDGTYEVTLQAVDVRGGQSEIIRQKVTVYSGELPQIDLENLTDPERELYHGEDIWHYRAVRSNLSGLDLEKPFTWDVSLRHNQQISPLIINNVAISDVLTISSKNSGGGSPWYQFDLTMLTEDGQEVQVSQDLSPEMVDLRIETRPRPTEILINQEEAISPHSFEAVVGIEQEVIVPPHLVFNNDIWVFNQWRTQGAAISLEPKLAFIAPEQDNTYTAAYVYDRPAEKIWIPLFYK